jgi:hypothetical protein
MDPQPGANGSTPTPSSPPRRPTPLPGPWIAAAIVLLVVGVASVAYNGWDLFLLGDDLAVFDRAGIGSVGSALLAIDVGLVVFGLLQVAGAVLVPARRDRVLALAGCVGTLLAWVAFVALVLGRDLMAGVSVGAWVMLLASTSGSVLAGGLLLTGASRLRTTSPT